MLPRHVAGWRLRRHVHVPAFFVGREWRPCAGVSCEERRVVLPGLRAVLAASRYRMKDPTPLAGAHVVPANVANRRILKTAGAEGSADHHDIAHHDRRRVPADDAIARRLAAVELLKEIDDSVLAE